MIRRGQPSVFVIAMTPFTEDGDVDYDAARAHLRRLREGGVGVYVAGGGSGEGHTLLPDEVDGLFALAVEELKGHVPVRAMGVEPRTARQMIELGRKAVDAGLDAWQIYSLDMGHLGSPAPDELERYFSDVLSAVDLPAVISTHFSVGYLVPLDVLNRLCARFDSIIGINCSISQDFVYLVRMLEELDPRIEVHVGGSMHTLSALAMGGTGYLSPEGNLVPKLARSLIDHYVAGDYDAAQEAYAKLLRIYSAPICAGDMKATFRALGLPGGYPRLPRLARTDPDGVEAVRKHLLELDIPELRPYLT